MGRKMVVDEDKVFDACALVEQISKMSNIEAMQAKADFAAFLLNQAMKEGEKVEENRCSVD